MINPITPKTAFTRITDKKSRNKIKKAKDGVTPKTRGGFMMVENMKFLFIGMPF